MANFITNSTNNKSVRKSQVVSLEIIENGGYILQLKLTERPIDVSFETDETLEGITTKAATILTNLEAE